MSSSIRNKFLLSFLLLNLIVKTNFAYALHCSDIKVIITKYLRTHYSINDLDKKLSKEALKNYIKSLDPSKSVFLEPQRQKLIDLYGKDLNIKLAKNDCTALEKIYSTYASSFEKQLNSIDKLINKKFNYNKDEYISFNRKKTIFPKTPAARDEFWRKTIKYQLMSLEETLDGDIKKAREKLSKRYSLRLKHHKEQTLSDIYGIFLTSFAITMDPHTYYFSPINLQDFNISTKLSLDGIGAMLRSEDGITTVESLIAGGAAFKGGLLKIKDQIIGVAQGTNSFVDIIDMNLRDVVSLIRGPRGTTVRLKVRRNKQIHIIPVVREKINLENQAAKSTIFNLQTKNNKKYRVGLIDLPSFYIDFQARQRQEKNYRSSSRDLIKETFDLLSKKIDLLILDLRSNGGGSLDEAITITGLFSGKGPVVQIKSQFGFPNTQNALNKSILKPSLPVILMINRQSASASEIIAGALKDYDRALIVGDSHTFGKGTVQNLMNLDGGLGAIKVTVSKFYRPLGSSTQLNGVYSHIAFPSFSDSYEIGEKHYPNPLAWDEIKSTTLKKYNMVTPYLAKLKNQSQKRIKETKSFESLEKAIVEFNKNMTKDKISLKKEHKKTAKKLNDDKNKENSQKQSKNKSTAIGKNPKIRPGSTKKIATKNTPKQKTPATKNKDKVLSQKPSTDFNPNLNEDPYLLETLYIAGDYLRLIGKEKLVSLQIEGYQPKKEKNKKNSAKKKSPLKHDLKKKKKINENITNQNGKNKIIQSQ